MQMDKAQRLRKAWGDKPCDHPHLEREYCLGAHTGDSVCTTCGEAFWDGRRPEPGSGSSRDSP